LTSGDTITVKKRPLNGLKNLLLLSLLCRDLELLSIVKRWHLLLLALLLLALLLLLTLQLHKHSLHLLWVVQRNCWLLVLLSWILILQVLLVWGGLNFAHCGVIAV
jgi:hypothetical protein